MNKNNFCIIIIAFNRANILYEAINSLKKSALSHQIPVLFFIDGARNQNDLINIARTVNVAKDFLRNRNQNIKSHDRLYISNKNMGLSYSVTNAIDETFKNFESALILEDDILLKEKSLEYCIKMLKKYKEDPEIMSICLNTPINYITKTNLFIKSKRATCWGWATWREKWRLMIDKKDISSEILEDFIDIYKEEVGLDSLNNLNTLINKNRDIWACRWIYSHVNNNKLSIIPRESFTQNIGLNGSGMNYTKKLNHFHYLIINIVRNTYLTKWISYILYNCFLRTKELDDNKLINYQLISYYSIASFKNLLKKKQGLLLLIIILLSLPLNIQLRYLSKIKYLTDRL